MIYWDLGISYGTSAWFWIGPDPQPLHFSGAEFSSIGSLHKRPAQGGRAEVAGEFLGGIHFLGAWTSDIHLAQGHPVGPCKTPGKLDRSFVHKKSVNFAHRFERRPELKYGS